MFPDLGPSTAYFIVSSVEIRSTGITDRATAGGMEISEVDSTRVIP